MAHFKMFMWEKWQERTKKININQPKPCFYMIEASLMIK